MYPIAFRLSGIRDFVPTEMDLGGPADDVLIGGLNGSGKSTLVYAMSFALVSGRIMVDGLRSKTLRRETDPWHARVGMLFHNPPGPRQKDAPEYVELVAEVKSPGGSERKYINYYLLGGETRDKLHQLRRFETRLQAHDYYRRVFDIDADGYFMFWYQGTIAEFANISDAARFQKVAEMFRLDDIQREWRIALEEMKRAQEDFERARTVALVKMRRLQELEKHKNALEQRNRLRRDALLLLETCYQSFLHLLTEQMATIKEKQTALRKQLEQLSGEQEKCELQMRDLQAQLETCQLHRQKGELKLKALEQALRRREQELAAWRHERDGLQKRVAEIESKIRHIHRTRDELQQEKGRLQQVLESLDKRLTELEEAKHTLSRQREDILKQAGALQNKAGELDNIIQNLKRLDQELPPAEWLKERESTLRRERDRLVVQSQQLEEQITRLEQEQQRLEKQQSLLLPEQEKILQIYRQAGIEAVAFGELFEAATAGTQAEQILAPLKHTIFVHKLLENVPVEKSFYIVAVGEGGGGLFFPGDPLARFSGLVRPVPAVQQRLSPEFLRGIKRWLSQVEILPAEESRPAGRGKLRLWRGLLWDSYGLRGPVDRQEALGITALQIARQKVSEQLKQARELLSEASTRLKLLSDELAQSTSLLHHRQDVDRELPARQNELAATRRELEQVQEKLVELTARLAEMEQARDAARDEQNKYSSALRQVEGELAVYVEYEREAASISRLRELEQAIARAENDQNTDKTARDNLLGELDLLAGEIKILLQRRDELAALASAGQRELEKLRQEDNQLSEQADSLELEAEELRQAREDMHRNFAAVINDLRSTGQWTVRELAEREITRANLERKLHEGRRQLEDALSRVVDEEAAVKYNDFAYEFNAAARELEECQLRFENLKRKEEEQRNRYDKAVYMRWKRANERFSRFMERLGMIGKIESIPPGEEERHPSYRWELHVSTRLGHKPERINPESGRLVGEGISGGERAATSLLFALALLGDIEQKPPFYVLDEFDSALDEERKHEIFDLFRQELGRKLIVVSPKVHGDRYLDRFGKFHCVVANPGISPGRSVSEIYEVSREKYADAIPDSQNTD
ncbi:MAG: hypothetical protein ACUVTU_09485 [Desulfurispora sp.]|uniref:hypothetical protein n=1 Tax=Desulfurispora sp. TaxID=3014275 RepID=UPI00404A6C3F